MVGRHTTKLGEEVLLVNMQDSHLLNTIGLVMRKMESIQSVVPIDPAVRTLYGRDMSFGDKRGWSGESMSEPDRYMAIARLAKVLEPYIAELFMRDHLLDMDGVVELRRALKSILKRDEARSYEPEKIKTAVKAIASSIGSRFDELDIDELFEELHDQ
jgi:hypothetical protein